MVADKYRIDAVLGQGGMGVVFSARHQVTGKQVALKWMLPEVVTREGAVERFVREAKIAGRIKHPHVVDIYDVGQDRSTIFLVMELLHGESLSSLLQRDDQDLGELLRLLSGAARGVAAAHAEGVIHRDLKPDNIFACSYPGVPRSAKVLDFGISKVAAADHAGPTLTAAGSALGTPYYMSPEQAKGQRDLDYRSDIYSFGVILYQVLTGRVPFDAETYNALIIKIVGERPAAPRSLKPELPEDLEAVVLQAMAYDREERYQSMSALAEAIDACAARLAARAEPPGASLVPVGDTREGVSRSATVVRPGIRWWLPAALLVLIGAGGLWAWAARSGDSSRGASGAAALSTPESASPAATPVSEETQPPQPQPSSPPVRDAGHEDGSTRKPPVGASSRTAEPKSPARVHPATPAEPRPSAKAVDHRSGQMGVDEF